MAWPAGQGAGSRVSQVATPRDKRMRRVRRSPRIAECEHVRARNRTPLTLRPQQSLPVGALLGANAFELPDARWGTRSVREQARTHRQLLCRDPGLVVEMQPAFALQAEEAGVLELHARLQRPGRVHVADRHVALVPQRVVGQAVSLQIVPDVTIGPVGDRMQFPAAVAQFQEVDAGARAGLIAAQAGDPGAYAQFVERALHGFHLAQPVVAIDAFDALFPESAHPRLHPGGADLRAVDL